MNRNSKWNANNGSRRPRRQHYQLLKNNEEEEEEEVCTGDTDIDNTLLVQFSPDEEYVEKVLDPGDTLQTLSLQFNCPVAELKRINHILRDNEIFARRKIKVPIKPGSVLTENLARVHLNNEISKDEGNGELDSSNIALTVSTSLDKISHDSLNVHSLSSQRITDNNYPGLSTPTENENGYLEAGIGSRSSTINNNQDILNDVECVENSDTECLSFNCSGADWGIPWLQLVICAVLLGFAGPLLYILYITEKKTSS